MVDTLALDNYVYLGMHVWPCRKKGTPNPAALNTRSDFLFGQPKIAAFSQKFLNQLRETHSQGKNAIIMDECFKDFTPEQRTLLIG
jgi:hypothetical protein